MGESERLQTIPMEFAVVKSHSPYNVILGRTGQRSLGVVASTIHSMKKFPTANGIVTVTIKKETLHECRRMEEAQGPTREEGVIFLTPDSEGTISMGREENMTEIPPSIAEHELKTYPHIEPRVQRKWSIAPDRRKVVKVEVREWLKVGIVRWTIEVKEAFQEIKKLFAELPTVTASKKEEELMVYLSAASEAASAVLLVERKGKQDPIHYISRTLQGAEINYPSMEKLVLALVHAARRLRKYFQGHKIKEAQEAKAPENLETEADLWKLYINGASNKHRSGAGLILIDPEGAEYSYALRLNFANSNNDAEYKALLVGLRIAAKIKVEKMHAFVYSKLVASQVEGSYESKGEKPKKYKEKALEMIRLKKGVLIEELNERSVDTIKINAINEEATRTWITPIQEYIEHGILPEDAAEALTIREKACNYTIEEDVLYRKSYLGPLLRCIGPQQAKYLTKEIHIRSYGMHDGPRRAVHKAMNAGYFWPSMHQDANNEVSSCDSCQVYASVPKLLKNDMIFVTSAWPFQK
nr:hypothetical protein [Tanacetum cinerariifolium]